MDGVIRKLGTATVLGAACGLAAGYAVNASTMALTVVAVILAIVLATASVESINAAYEASAKV